MPTDKRNKSAYYEFFSDVIELEDPRKCKNCEILITPYNTSIDSLYFEYKSFKSWDIYHMRCKTL